MSLANNLRYHFVKDLGAPAFMGFSQVAKKRRPRKPSPHFGPPLKSTRRLREIMTRHYYLSRYAQGAKPVAWVTSGAPVELLRPFEFYTIYPENHGALCGAQKVGSELCAAAEDHGYHQDLCSYARIDLGHYFSGKTPVGSLPKPDLLFCSNNICQTVVYWYKALREAGISRGQIKSTVATGYGRVSVPSADGKVTEISCHGLGAQHLFPETGTVIDIGGQDSKMIRVGEGGKVLDFTMNDKCAAGTGRFLEVMAAKLRLSLDEMGELSLRAGGEVRISSVCTVFAESEVVSLVAQNHPKEEIIRGVHRAIVNRMWSMIQTVGVHGAVTMSGGVAKNRGVVALMEEKLGCAMHLHVEPQIIGALGAALMAGRREGETS